MSKLSPVLELGLLDQLGIVDGSSFFRGSEGNPSEPENVAPSGVDVTTKDTGAPGSFLDRFKSADTTTQALTVGGVVLGVIAIAAVVKAVL